MIIAVLLAILVFGPIGYFLARMVVHSSLDNDRPYLGLVYLFLTLAGALSLLSFLALGGLVLFGFSMGATADLAASRLAEVQFGYLTGLVAVLVGLWGVIGIFTGPACAFSSATVATIAALIFTLAKVDDYNTRRWLPVVVAGIVAFNMWPFAAYLTFGL